MLFEILNEQGEVIKTILADEGFAQENHPGAWRLAEYQEPQDTPAGAILQTIVNMEREQLMSRINREFILGAMKREAAEAGISEQLLETHNKGYRLLKQFDGQIAALREQYKALGGSA